MSAPKRISEESPGRHVPRYQLHSVIGMYARMLLQKDYDPRAACLRHATHYADKLAKLSERYGMGGSAVIQSVKESKREWPQICRGYGWTMQYRGDTEFDTLRNNYPLLGSPILWVRQTSLQYIEWRRMGSEAAQELERFDDLACHLATMAAAHVETGSLEEASRVAEVVLQMQHIPQEHTTRGVAYACPGLANSYRDQNPSAISSFQKAIDIFRSLENDRSTAITLQNLAIAHAGHGDEEQASACLEEAEQLHDKIKDKRLDALLWEKQARIGTGNDAPRDLLVRSLDVFSEFGYDLGTVRSLTTLADHQALEGQADQAIDTYMRAIELAVAIGTRPVEAIARLGLAEVYARVGELARATGLGQQAANLFGEIGNVTKQEEAARHLLDWEERLGAT